MSKYYRDPTSDMAIANFLAGTQEKKLAAREILKELHSKSKAAGLKVVVKDGKVFLRDPKTGTTWG